MNNPNDLIPRNAAIEAFDDERVDRNYGDVSPESVIKVIKSIPAVNAAPVVHGRWIDIPDKPEWDQKMCSICGDYFCCQGNYCPNCGAKMDDERRDSK